MKLPLLFLSLVIFAACGQTTPTQAQAAEQTAPNNPLLPPGVVPTTPAPLPTRPMTPVTDPNFLILPNGTDLRTVKVSGERLSLTRGTGSAWGATQQSQYMAIKARTRSPGDPKIQWAIMDLDDHVMVDQSALTDKRMFGASVSKIFVAGTLLDKERGNLTAKQIQLMSDMLVVSSNTAWLALQDDIGDGNTNRGRQLNYDFTQRMGYKNTRGFQGSWNGMHGNELSVGDLAEFLYDVYQGRFAGSEVMWKIMHTSRTGTERAKKYIPSDIFVGSKTGTYAGSTVDPETGKGITVDVAHQVMVVNVDGKEYAIVVLSDTGNNETAAILAGGLLREYTGNGRYQ